MDPSWSETGDRYLIKLFRDYLFHQVTETGEPWLDMSHIVSSLNKVREFSKNVVKLKTVLDNGMKDVLVCMYDTRYHFRLLWLFYVFMTHEPLCTSQPRFLLGQSCRGKVLRLLDYVQISPFCQNLCTWGSIF